MKKIEYFLDKKNKIQKLMYKISYMLWRII